MDLNNAYAVIMAGGNGERFWPISTRAKPKQFLSLFGGKPLLALAVERLKGLLPPERIFVITADRLLCATAEAAPGLPSANLIGEPCRRDTAAAVASACGFVRRLSPDGVACILTADQLIEDEAAFRRVLRDAVSLATEKDAIVTLGIHPSYPATGFGYIELGKALATATETAFCEVERFVEKPPLETAKAYLESGRFLWNAGMFIWRAGVMQRALAENAPALASLSDRIAAAPDAETARSKMAAGYPALTPISIDFAVMEHVRNILVARCSFGWDDVGSWSALAGHFQPDADGNVVLGSCEQVGAQRNVVVSEGRLTALIGVEGLAVIQTANATLVCPLEQAQRVKALLKKISARDDADAYL